MNTRKFYWFVGQISKELLEYPLWYNCRVILKVKIIEVN